MANKGDDQMQNSPVHSETEAEPVDMQIRKRPAEEDNDEGQTAASPTKKFCLPEFKEESKRWELPKELSDFLMNVV